jgi:hypothetical protein
MVTKEIAPVRCWNIPGANPISSTRLKIKEIGSMKLTHHPQFINELPLWTAARVRDLKRPNPATAKLRRRLGVSESLACVMADLSGLGSKEGWK